MTPFDFRALAITKSRPRPGLEVIVDPFNVFKGVSHFRHQNCRDSHRCTGVGCRAQTGKTRRTRERNPRKRWEARKTSKPRKAA